MPYIHLSNKHNNRTNRVSGQFQGQQDVKIIPKKHLNNYLKFNKKSKTCFKNLIFKALLLLFFFNEKDKIEKKTKKNFLTLLFCSNVNSMTHYGQYQGFEG